MSNLLYRIGYWCANQKRDSYHRGRSQGSADSHASDSDSGVPSSKTTEPSLPKQTWSEWLFGSSSSALALTSPKKSSRKKKPSNNLAIQSRFIFKNHSKSQSAKPLNDPGLTSADIVEFVYSLPRHADLDKKGLEVRLHYTEPRFLFDRLHTQIFCTIFRNLFECLAFDEAQWGNRRKIPGFGTPDSLWSRKDPDYAENITDRPDGDVKTFYDYWTKFETAKSFEWIARFVPRSATISAKTSRW